MRGKRGRQVPILINHEESSAIKALIQFGKNVGVAEQNKYVFAAPTRGSLNTLRGNDCMAKVLKSIDGLVSPERIHSTELRKYCATISQIADLSENDLRWLADHFGHHISVHREYYRLKDLTVQLAKVSRLLLAIDEGRASQLAGKKLDEISVEGDFSTLN